jgi:hypothetical protein
MSTFDGPEHLSKAESVKSPIALLDLEKMSINIVKHIQEVSSGNIQIQKMKLYFKLDQYSRFWLVSCAELKIKNYEKDINSLKKTEEIVTELIAWPAPRLKESLNENFKISKGLNLFTRVQSNYCPICLVHTDTKHPIAINLLLKVNFKTEKELLTILERIWTEVTPDYLS